MSDAKPSEAEIEAEATSAYRTSDDTVRKQQQEMPIVFAALAIAHIVGLYVAIPLSEQSRIAWPAWIAYGGIGSLAVWFAWTSRPMFERVMRVVILCGCIYMTVTNVIPYHMHRGIHDQRQQLSTYWERVQKNLQRSGNLPPNFDFDTLYKDISRRYPYIERDTLYTLLLCWCTGATLVAYLATWFSGFRLLPPGTEIVRRPLSIQSIMLVTFAAALAFFFVQSRNPASRMLYFVNGMTTGLIASVVTWSMFQGKAWRILVPPFLTVAAVVALDLTFGRMAGAWKGSVTLRAVYVFQFAAGLTFSPAVTAMVLRKAGYRLMR